MTAGLPTRVMTEYVACKTVEVCSNATRAARCVVPLVDTWVITAPDGNDKDVGMTLMLPLANGPADAERSGEGGRT